MATDAPGAGKSRDAILFQHILLMFQTLALQQMGKLTNPMTGTVERDLHQARITIDMLGMLQRKTSGNLEENEKRLLDTIVLELQMNFVDESGRSEDGNGGKETPGDGEPPQEDGPGGEDAGGRETE